VPTAIVVVDVVSSAIVTIAAAAVLLLLLSLGAALKNFPAQKKKEEFWFHVHKSTQETPNQITRAGRATSHVYPGDKSPIFYKTASAEIAPCDIIIAPLLG